MRLDPLRPDAQGKNVIRRMKAAFRLSCVYLVTTLLGAGGFAATSMPASAGESYARFCSEYQTMTSAQFSAAARRDSDLDNRLPDADVIAAVKAHVAKTAAVSVAIRQFNSIAGYRYGQKTAVAQVREGSRTRYVVVAYANGNRVASIKPISADTISQYYRFARTMAAYILLNDLMASDSTIPRLGCSCAADVQLYAMNGVLPEVKQAYLATPDQDPVALTRALAAYRTFAASSSARRNPRTQETLHNLGDTPAISLIYRDVVGSGPSADEYDVVRLSTGNVRTYAGFTIEHDKAELTSPGLCVVGDSRCAGSYEWP